MAAPYLEGVSTPYLRAVHVSSPSCVQELPVARRVLANAMLAVLLASSTRLTRLPRLQRESHLSPKDEDEHDGRCLRTEGVGARLLLLTLHTGEEQGNLIDEEQCCKPLHESEEALDPLCPKVEWNIDDNCLKLITTVLRQKVDYIEYFNCRTLFDLSWRNWFRIARLVTIIAIGLRNPYAKSGAGPPPPRPH
jgi:hypothetical protein